MSELNLHHSEAPPSLGFELLMTMEVATLWRLAPRAYQFCGLAPLFYTQLFPHDADGAHCRAPWDHSPMLEFFLDEAEDFFELTPEPGATLSSGLWVETLDSGEELPLAATARTMKRDQVILIQAVREEYAERVRILRRARVDILEKRKMAQALKSAKKKNPFDSLTRLYNREAFLDLVQGQIAALPVYAPNLALMMLEIDGFKALRDGLGDQAGDQALRQLGRILRHSLRKSDAAVRYGGGEFAVIAPGTSLPQSFLAAERLCALIAAADFGSGGRLTVSLGCTIYRPGENYKEFIARAVLALQDAQKAGQNQVRQRDPWGKLAALP